ncbi:MAG: lipopolysaccharide heptosyltransferase II [Candidatus Aminicenantes bacterium]|nr:lipopolysaccharide heptosyltransferase II [Candidatus Aminicenantes bacterium]
MKIVVRTPNWVGDAVMALPAVDDLKRNHPEAEVWVAGPPWAEDLFLRAPKGGGFVPLGRLRSAGDVSRAADTLKAHRFDAGLLLTNSFASALLFRRAGIPERWGYRRDGRGLLLTKGVGRRDGGRTGHMVRYYLDLIEGLGMRVSPPEIRLAVRDDERARAAGILRAAGADPARPVVILNAGASYGPAKRWPTDRFAEAGERLAAAFGAVLVLTGSAEDAAVGEELSSRLGPKAVNLVGRTSLRELLATVSLASLFITNDTGPMHLANALRVPVVAVFGPTDPAVTAPFHPPAVVLRKEAVCWPCLYRACPYDHRCMAAVAVDDVLAAAEEFLR